MQVVMKVFQNCILAWLRGVGLNVGIVSVDQSMPSCSMLSKSGVPTLRDSAGESRKRFEGTNASTRIDHVVAC